MKSGRTISNNAWRWATSLVASAMLLAGAHPAPVAASGDSVKADQIILRLRRASDLPAIANQYALDAAPLDRLPVAPLYLMHIADGGRPEQRAGDLSNDPRVLYAEPNVIGQGASDQGESSWASGESSWASGESSWASGGPEATAAQAGLSRMRVPQALGVNRGAKVTVAVLDTGVDRTHPALVSHLLPGQDFVDNDADPSEVGAPGPGSAFGHGTAISGLVAMVAPEAKIQPVRVLDQSGAGDIWRLAKAMVWAADPDGNPETADGADIINMSLSTYLRTNLTKDLLDGLSQNGHGIVIVAAAGNFGTNQPMYPAAENGRVLSVGAVAGDDTPWIKSNYGSWVRVSAPGVGLMAPVPRAGYVRWSGTSMSAALVSGEAALVRAAKPGMRAQAVTDWIVRTADRLSNSAVAPRVNAAAALGL